MQSSDEHLDVTTITGQTAETSIADGDTSFNSWCFSFSI